jgi:hypothetical protein
LLRVNDSWGADVLDVTLATLIKAFTRHPATWDADMIQAVARLLGLNDGLDVDRIITVLGQHSVAQWRVRSMNKPAGSVSRAILLASEIATEYNRRLRPVSRIKATR